MKPTHEHYPTPINLADLVAASGVDGVHDLALSCEALEIAPKPNQVWRCVLEEQVIIGYKATAVIAGRDELAMAYVSARLHHMANETTNETQYHAYAMAMDMRKLLTNAVRLTREVDITGYADLVARLADMDEVAFIAVMRLLSTYAPDIERAAVLAMACYERGVQDGLDAATPAIDDDAYFLPEPPLDYPPPNLVKSA